VAAWLIPVTEINCTDVQRKDKAPRAAHCSTSLIVGLLFLLAIERASLRLLDHLGVQRWDVRVVDLLIGHFF
jgi:hypothetical protein